MLLNTKRHIDQRSAEFNMISLLFKNNTSMSTETIVFFTNVGYAFPAILDHYKTIEDTDGSCKNT